MSPAEAPPPYEILEHTADIGLRAYGGTLEELFENAAWGMAEILDVDHSARAIEAAAIDAATPARSPSARTRGAPGGYAPRPQRIALDASDVEALLVDWLNELILLTEEGKACLVGVQVDQAGENGLQADVHLVDCDPLPEGTDLKAATYHQLSVRRTEKSWEAIAYFDV
jgi:SHS2 domain-containing protein